MTLTAEEEIVQSIARRSIMDIRKEEDKRFIKTVEEIVQFSRMTKKQLIKRINEVVSQCRQLERDKQSLVVKFHRQMAEVCKAADVFRHELADTKDELARWKQIGLSQQTTIEALMRRERNMPEPKPESSFEFVGIDKEDVADGQHKVGRP